MAALCILWFAVMAALKGSEVTKEAAAPIESFGKDIGSVIKSLPKYAPVIPTSHGMASMSSLPRISSQVKNAIDSTQTTRANRIGNSINDTLGLNNEFTKKLNAANALMTRADAQQKNNNYNVLHDYAQKVGFTPADFRNASARDSLLKYIDAKTTKEPGKDEVLKAIKNLDGSDESFRLFLEKYNEKLVTPDKQNGMNEVHEYNNVVAGGQATRSSGSPS